MNKKFKKAFLIIGIIIFVYTVLICIECFRFYHFLCSKPLITISEVEEENQITYYGMGYSILYKYNTHQYSNDNIGREIYSGEFRLFSIPIQDWIT